MIHLGNQANHIVVVCSSLQIKEDEVQCRVLCLHLLGILLGILCLAFCYRIRLFVQLLDLLKSHLLVMCVLDARFCITATDAADAVLRVVAINDCRIDPLCNAGRSATSTVSVVLPGASSLGGECHILCLFHFVCL